MTDAELVVIGRVATLADDSGGFGWAEAIAISGGRVVASGSRDDVEAAAGPRTQRVVIGPDEVAVPGLTDSHIHLAETALGASRVDLAGAASVEDAIAVIRDAARGTPGDRWLEGRGWDADRFGGWPTADDLERAAPGRRVALWQHDHHAIWVSRAALAAARIDDATPDPGGGVIRRDRDGGATGILHEKAARLVTSLVPLAGADEVAEAVVTLERELIRLGVVAVHDTGGLSDDRSIGRGITAYRALAAAGRLRLRVHACVRAEQLDAAIAEGFRSGTALAATDAPLVGGWLKLFADGTLGSRTAALLDPLDSIAGEPPPPNDGFGVWVTEPEELAALARRAAGAGIASTIHAIGDAAVRSALDAVEPTVGRTPLMPRLEHVQLLADADLSRFAANGIAASVQPIHVRSDAEKARRLWGPRAEARGYAFASLARSGANVSFGTDAPVEPIDPWSGLACSVTRASPEWPDGTPPFGPAEALTLDRALRAQCVDPALSAGERDRGRLAPGYRADLLVIPAAALEEPVEVGGSLWNARPRLVLIGGEVAFEA